MTRPAPLPIFWGSADVARRIREDEPPAIERVIAQVSITSPTTFTVGGAVTRVPELEDLREQASTLVGTLAQVLYEQVFARSFDSAGRTIAPAKPDRSLVKTLRAANTSRNRWEGGWVIEPGVGTDRYVVRRNREARLVHPGEFVLDDPQGWPPAAGARARLRVPREARRLQDGYYVALGETLPDIDNAFDLVRLYWNARLGGAAALVHSLTMLLNRFRIPFRLECLAIPAHYDRVDSAVLSVSKRYFPITAQLIADSWPQLTPQLLEETPLFARPLAPGLAVAEDLEEGESFGGLRCVLLAEGLWDAHVARVQSDADRLACVAERFSAAGFSLEQAHLNAGSTHVFELPPVSATSVAAIRVEDPRVATAVEIGAVLCRNAVWSGNQCAWFGDLADPVRGAGGFVHSSMGGNLYSGSAGIAVFLAELAHVTEDRTFAAVARAGAEHALSSASDTLLRHGTGFFFGIAGVVHAVGRIGDSLSLDSLGERARALSTTLPALNAEPAGSSAPLGLAIDAVALVDSGDHNAVVQSAALAVQREIDRPGAHDYSLAHGITGLADVLLVADERANSALANALAAVGVNRFGLDCSWPSSVRGGQNPGLMTGLAGTGYFYLRLHDPAAIPTMLRPPRA